MKKLILAAFALTTAASVFAQGTIWLNNRSAAGTSHVWGPSATTPSLSLVGQAATGDSPAATTDYVGAGMAPLAGPNYLVTLLGATGADVPEASLVPQSIATSFRTGSGAGFIALQTVTLSAIPLDAPVATMQLFAWDNSSGLYPTYSTALAEAWAAGTVAAGKSLPVNVEAIGGSLNTPPQVGWTSFNIYFIPEPSSMVLAGLGAAALLIFRRRN